MANAIGQSYDLAGLYAVADALSTFYCEQGYAFAKVFIPENGFSQGVLTLQIVKGRYGQLRAEADSPTRRVTGSVSASNHAAATARCLR